MGAMKPPDFPNFPNPPETGKPGTSRTSRSPFRERERFGTGFRERVFGLALLVAGVFGAYF